MVPQNQTSGVLQRAPMGTVAVLQLTPMLLQLTRTGGKL